MEFFLLGDKEGNDELMHSVSHAGELSMVLVVAVGLSLGLERSGGS